ncbi:MAG: homoserine dehydrogenase [Synergistaceae bacterium]|jgi:homoserine dehydrogenase|nr:homoserine dehydrogenase [Synergistaceae bacterium]
MIETRVGLVGCGTVGRGLVELFGSKSSYYGEKYGVTFKLIFVTDVMKGTAFADEGLDARSLLTSLEGGRNLSLESFGRASGASLPELLSVARLDVLCEAAPTNYKTGEPGMTILKSSLSAGVSAVTSSKGAIGLDMAGLKSLARGNGAILRYESSVMSGTPLINLVRGPLAGCDVLRVEGILNGTTNYILTKMESGMSYRDALAEAQKLGYAEADPTGDVEGFDAAVKVCIMANEFFGKHLPIDGVRRTGITGVTAEDVAEASRSGARIKLIAGVERLGAEVSGYVGPRRIEASNPLASISGATNAVTITTDNLGDVTIIGPGAGKLETAQGMVSDILNIVLLKHGCK